MRARQRLTFWLRVAVAGVAMLLALAWFQNSGPAGNPAEAGRMVFGLLAWLGFGFCLLEGARQTADAISAEHREGTLGFLFLTDLSGLDVVLGKLLAGSVHSMYALLAVFPVLGITLVAGGVTAGEFWRTQLALITTLLLASTAGLWVSARSRDDARSALASLGVVIGVALVPLLVDAAGRGLLLPSLSPAAGLWFAGDGAYRMSVGRFWWTQAAVVGLAGAFLVGAGWKTARAWRQEPLPAPLRPAPVAREAWNYRVTPRLHARPDPHALEANPVAWLVRRHSGPTALIWVAVALPTVHLLLFQFASQFASRFFASPASLVGLLSFLQIAVEVLSFTLLAFVAARMPARARRDGTLELLLSTPLTARAVVQGHWGAYWRRLRLPLVLYAVVPIGIYLLVWTAAQPGRAVVPWSYLLLGQMPRLATDVVQMIATGWLGLWFGLAAPSLSQAVGRTLGLVVLVPWLAGMLVSLVVSAFLRPIMGSIEMTWAMMLWMLSSLVGIVWLLGLVRWARRRLLDRLREAVTSDLRPSSFTRWWTRWSSTKST